MTISPSPEPPRPGGLERWVAAHPVLIDVLLIVSYEFVTAVQLLSIAAFDISPVSAIALLLGGLVVGGIRRRAPLVAVGFAGVAAALAIPVPLPPVILLVVATVALRVDVRIAWIACGVVSVGLVSTSIVWFETASHAVFGVLVLLIGMGLGLWIRTRRAYVRALVELADRVRAEQNQRAEAAVAEERARIAREMHDVVAHGLSVMVRLADGAHAIAVKEPQRSRDAVQRIGTVGRESLADMRRVLGVLRTGHAYDQGAPTLPQPSVADLERLVDDQRAAGLPVTLRASDVGHVTESLATTIYRIVQECLTNTSRYAIDVTVVDVNVMRRGKQIVIVVQDDGHAPASSPSQGSGRGLVGLRERAALYDGAVEAGQVEPHGWRVHVVLAAEGDE